MRIRVQSPAVAVSVFVRHVSYPSIICVFYRCRLSSGKVIWLCDEHAKEMKVTVLAKDAVSLQKKAASTEQPEFIAKWLREINAEKLAKKFNSAEKVKKNFNRKFSN